MSLSLRQRLCSHYAVFHRRVESECHDRTALLHAMRRVFAESDALRQSCALHWPLGDGPLQLVPLAQAVSPSTEYVYYEFIEQLSLKQAPPVRDEKIHLLPLREYHTSFDPLPLEQMQWFPRQAVSLETHKLQFSVAPPCHLTLTGVTGGGRVVLGAGTHQLLLVNATLRLPPREEFTGLTVCIPNQCEPLALEYETLCRGAHPALDLRSLAGPGQLCAVTATMPLTIEFTSECAGEMHLRTDAECSLTLRDAALEYWTGGSALQPFTYSLVDSELLEAISQLGSNSPPRPLPACPRSPTRGYETDIVRLNLLRQMQVRCNGTPRFFIDDEMLGVVADCGHPLAGTLVYRGFTLATFVHDAHRGHLQLRLIFDEEKRRVNRMQMYIY